MADPLEVGHLTIPSMSLFRLWVEATPPRLVSPKPPGGISCSTALRRQARAAAEEARPRPHRQRAY